MGDYPHYYLVRDRNYKGEGQKMSNKIKNRCCDCREVYELDALDLDLRCAACVEQSKIDEGEGE